MRPFRLRRTVGYAEVNGIRTKKYYVSLEGHDAIAAPVDMAGRSAGVAVPSLDCAMPTLRKYCRIPLDRS